jgi:hypothetical protein
MGRHGAQQRKTPLELKEAVEEAFSKFKADRRLRQANEATTRVELIDRVLQAVDWPSFEVDREVPSGTGRFLDYELRAGRDPWLVLEAKRIGATFELTKDGPKTTGTMRPVQGLLARGGEHLRDVMEQAATYANARGIPLACVSNGYQWIFFRGLSSQDRPWPKGWAIVFSTVEEILARFDDFLGCIGRAWAGTSYLPRLLDRPVKGPIPTPRVPRQLIPGRRPSSNSERVALLRSINQMLFTDIYGEDRREMLERCYVQPGIGGDFERSVQRLLKDSARPFSDDSSDIEQLIEGDTSKFVHEVSKQEKSGFKDPILVVGHVGVGKTTFLNRALAEFRTGDSAFCGLIDLEGRGHGGTVDATAEERAIAREILAKLGTAAQTVLKHRGVSEAEREQANPSAAETLRTLVREKLAEERELGEKLWVVDPTAWLRKEYEVLDQVRADSCSLLLVFIRHLRARFKRKDHLRYPILIVLDNLDQATSEYQQCVYGLAQRIARQTPAVVIVCLREDTYMEGVERGGFLTSSPMPLVQLPRNGGPGELAFLRRWLRSLSLYGPGPRLLGSCT